MLGAAKPTNVRRYATIIDLLARHGGGDWLREAGLLGAQGKEMLPLGSPESLAQELEAQGPTFVKLGQMMAARPDVLPERYISALKRLQSDVEPIPARTVRDIIEAELGTSVDRLFTTFDDEPQGAASIGQVHRATLRDGREVVVKVQRPDIRPVIEGDLDALAHVAAAMQRHSSVGERYGTFDMVRHFRRSVLAELDYEQEARNLDAMAKILADRPHIVVPRPVHDYTTPRVLTMDFLDGVGLSDVHPIVFTELDRDELARELCRGYLDQVLSHGFFHADPHPGNLKLLSDRRLGLLDLGQVEVLSPSTRSQLLKLVLSLLDGRTADVAVLLEGMGRPLDGYDAMAFRAAMADVVQHVSSPAAPDGRVGASLLATARVCADHFLRPPTELSLLGKTLLQLDEVAGAIAPDLDANALIEEYSGALMTKHALSQLRPGELFQDALTGSELIRNAPRRLDRILQLASGEGLMFRADVQDLPELLAAVRKVANRITIGLVVSALIVGAALIMPIQTTHTLFGYPLLAITLFLFAALLGCGMVAITLWSDFRASRRQRPTKL